jgi:hypothetical protein
MSSTFFNNNNNNNNYHSPFNFNNIGNLLNNNVVSIKKRQPLKTLVPLDERVKLESIYGFTVSSNARLAQCYSDGTVAYLAGCVIVLYHYENQKYDFIISSAKKTLTSIDFSTDGKYVVTGEVHFIIIFLN